MNKNKAQIFHFDLYGKREEKYDFLNENSLASVDWTELKPEAPNFFFVNKNMQGQEEYEKGFKVDELFTIYNTGIETGRDDFFIDVDQSKLKEKIIEVFYNKENDAVCRKYKISDTTSFKFKTALSAAKIDEANYKKILYRPFDIRYTYYDASIQRRPSFNTMKHLMYKNMAFSTCRQQSTFDFQHILVSNLITERCTVSLQTKETGYVFPLYLYPDESSNALLASTERVPNFNMEIVDKIAKGLRLTFTNEKENGTSTRSASVSFSPIDILDYIYAVLHSPTYREQYKEFLKIDFPRIPFPEKKEKFWQLVKLGGELRQIHLLESSKVEQYITQYPEDGDNIVGKPRFVSASLNERGKVYINETQYFDNVPQVAWEFYIGGYQPAQKWLKDRKDRALDFEEILHYQKIIVALSETNRLMKEIDKIGIE